MGKDGRTDRRLFTELSDRQLLEQCEVDCYRASGPGGQKRNKTSSAVRLRHAPTGFLVIAEESRSQHENRARALRRLRQMLYLKIREDVPAEGNGDRPLNLGINPRNEQFWPQAAWALDCLHARCGRIAEAAGLLGVSTGQLVDFLESQPKVWEQANHIRREFGHKPLR